ncbi:MAG: glycosyltransferase family 2 protein [Candidatus Accumulibacter sp.]|nr:glycosyltransferase family 2 protein [Accumulibacter sp.]
MTKSGQRTVFLAWEEYHAEIFNTVPSCHEAEFFPVNQKAAAPWLANGRSLTLPPFWQLYQQSDLVAADCDADRYIARWRDDLLLEANAARAWLWSREASYLRRLLAAFEKFVDFSPRYLVPRLRANRADSWHGAGQAPITVMEILAAEGAEVQWISVPMPATEIADFQSTADHPPVVASPWVLFSTFAVPDLADHLARLLDLAGLSILLLVDPCDPLPSTVIEKVMGSYAGRVLVATLARHLRNDEKPTIVAERLAEEIIATGPNVTRISAQLNVLVDREGLIGCLVSNHHAVQTSILRRLCKERRISLCVLPHSVWPMPKPFSLGVESAPLEVHVASTRRATAHLAAMGHQGLASRPFPSPRYRARTIRLLRRLHRWLLAETPPWRVGVVVTSGEENMAPDLALVDIANRLRALCLLARTSGRLMKLHIRLRDREDRAEVLKVLIGPDADLAEWEKSSQRTPFAYLQAMDLVVEVGTPGSVTYESFAQVVPFIRMETAGHRQRQFLLPNNVVPTVSIESCNDLLKYVGSFRATMLALWQFLHLVRETKPEISFDQLFHSYSASLGESENTWVLVEGKLTTEQRVQFVNTLLDSNTLDADVLPIQPSGTVHEIIRRSSGMRIDPNLSTRAIDWFERTWRMAWRAWRTWTYLSSEQRHHSGLTLPRIFTDLTDAYRIATLFRGIPYAKWIKAEKVLHNSDRHFRHRELPHRKKMPHFVVVLSGSDATARATTIASLKGQTFRHFKVVDVPPQTAEDDSWLLALSEGDQLAEHALHWLACEVQSCPTVELIYFDDDQLDETGKRHRPRFKPSWSLAHLRAHNYIGRSVALSSLAVEAAGGWGNNGLYDLLLRMAERSRGEWSHIPAVLLHYGRPQIQDDRRELAALNAHLARSNSGRANVSGPSCRRVRFDLPPMPPMVSIVIPTRDAPHLLRQCVESLLAKTTYPRFEIVVVNNGSRDQDALSYLAEIALRPRITVLDYDRPFNYSAINNFAERQVSGEVLCLLNNDTEVISPDWLDEMVGHLRQANVGVVGAKLYYPDGRVQHGGDTVGPGGCANHLHQFIARDDPGYCNRAVVAQELSAVTAACMVTWRGLYKKLGGLNERWLPVAFNDVDYCLRVRRAGHKVVWTPHAKLYHHESVSRGKNKGWRREIRAWCEVRYMRWHWHREMKSDPFYNPNFSYLRPDFVLGPAPNVSRPWLELE